MTNERNLANMEVQRRRAIIEASIEAKASREGGAIFRHKELGGGPLNCGKKTQTCFQTRFER
jgi:hypothetical protein